MSRARDEARTSRVRRPRGFHTAVLGLTLVATPCVPLAAQDSPAGKDTAADPPAVIRLLLLSETGEPLEGGRLEIQPVSGAAGLTREAPGHGYVRELGGGRYVSGDLAPGPYQIRAVVTGHAEAAVTVRLHAGEVREVTLGLSRQPVALPEIVAAARGGGELRSAGRAVDFVSFRDRPLGAATLAEWLEGLPGVSVRRSAAGRQLVSVRGSRPEGVLVLLDGVPLNDPVTGVADLTGIPASALESVTLVRGAGPEFGPGSLAGVLVLRSARTEHTSAFLGLETGSYGRRAADAHLSAAGDAGRVSASLRMEEVENDFRFENRLLPGRPTETRRNADTRRAHASLAAMPSGLPLLLRLRLDGLDQGAPGRMGTALFDRARWEENGFQATAEAGNAEPSAVGSYRRRALRYRDPRAGREEEQVVHELHLRGGLPLQDGWRLSGHLERASVHGDGVATTAARLSGGAALSGRTGIGPVEAAPGIALDLVDGGPFWSPSLGLAVHAGGGWTLRSRAGQALRLPAFGDRYTASSPRVRPNPTLRPERIVLDLEVGGSWTATDGRGGARLAAYHRRTADPIVWLTSAVAVWSPRNLDRLTAEGVEAHAFWHPSADWRLEVAASRERSRVGFGTNGNPLPYAPGFQGRASLERSWRERALRLDLQALGGRTTSLAGTHRLPGMVLLGVTGRQEFSVRGQPMTVDVRLRNVLDTRYELVSLVPEPGRSLELRLQIGPVGKSAKRPEAAYGETLNRE